jgi:G:T-mismatch repair DNA endonuclease (very short patch repair protein)
MLEAEQVPFLREKVIGRMHVDIFLDPSTVIELQGCFWHGCLVCNRITTKAQQAAIVKDARREYILRKRGYDVVVIWEHDVKHHPARVRAMLRGIWDGIQKKAA